MFACPVQEPSRVDIFHERSLPGPNLSVRRSDLPRARKMIRYGALIISAAIWWMAGLYLYLSPQLPEESALRNITLRTPMRVLSRDGALIGQFGEQKRKPLRYEEIPQSFIDALLAAEDDGFFDHHGIEPLSLLRAVSELILTGRKGSGGSTLTMQVARNYFLTLDQTFLRKFTEILLAFEIEARFSKEEIFELYVNRVFLGHRVYDSKLRPRLIMASPWLNSIWHSTPCWRVCPKHPLATIL